MRPFISCKHMYIIYRPCMFCIKFKRITSHAYRRCCGWKNLWKSAKSLMSYNLDYSSHIKKLRKSYWSKITCMGAWKTSFLETLFWHITDLSLVLMIHHQNFTEQDSKKFLILCHGLITNLENTKVIRKYIVATTLRKFKCLNRVEINGYEEKIFPTWF